MLYHYEHYMSILRMALIGAIVHLQLFDKQNFNPEHFLKMAIHS